VRFTDDVKQAVMKRAADEHRSFAGHIEHLVVADLRESGYLPPLQVAESEAS
jgi:hypothetical protein